MTRADHRAVLKELEGFDERHAAARLLAFVLGVQISASLGGGGGRHVGDVETSYSFSSYEKLLADDFWADVDAWRQGR